MSYLEGKVAIVTGGAQGIGRGIVLAMAKAGADMVIADLNREKAESVVAEVNALGRDALAILCDVTDEDIIDKGITTALNHFPRIDILVNNAGIAVDSGYLDATPEEFDLNYRVNLKSVWLLARALAPHLKSNNSGKIINIASGAARQGLASAPAYSAAKTGVISLTQSLAATLGTDNINVNAICPGLVKTPLTDNAWDIDKNPEAFDQYIKQHVPLGRITLPEDIGNAVVFLASSAARNITGQTLNVNGGDVLN